MKPEPKIGVDMAESTRIISQLSRRVLRRLPASSVLSLEDIQQEMWIAWCAAREAFDATRGVPFGAFLYRGLINHINRYVHHNVWRFPEQTFALSLDFQYSGENSEGTLGDVIASDAEAPEIIVERQSCYQAALKRLSQRARVFVILLHEQPRALVREVMLAADKAEHAKKIGAPFAQPKRITASLVFDLMGAPALERKKIVAEVAKVGAKISR